MSFIRQQLPAKYSDRIQTDGLPENRKPADQANIDKLKKAMDDYQMAHPRATAREVRRYAAKAVGVDIIAKSTTIKKKK